VKRETKGFPSHVFRLPFHVFHNQPNCFSK